jgi:hypothetical protein
MHSSRLQKRLAALIPSNWYIVRLSLPRRVLESSFVRYIVPLGLIVQTSFFRENDKYGEVLSDPWKHGS